MDMIFQWSQSIINAVVVVRGGVGLLSLSVSVLPSRVREWKLMLRWLSRRKHNPFVVWCTHMQYVVVCFTHVFVALGTFFLSILLNDKIHVTLSMAMWKTVFMAQQARDTTEISYSRNITKVWCIYISIHRNSKARLDPPPNYILPIVLVYFLFDPEPHIHVKQNWIKIHGRNPKEATRNITILLFQPFGVGKQSIERTKQHAEWPFPYNLLLSMGGCPWRFGEQRGC